MKPFYRSGMTAVGVALVLAAGTIAVLAQGDKLAAIKARQAFMKAQGADVKALIEYTKGQATQAVALRAANDLYSRAPKIIGLFVPGTSAADFPGKTYAKPDIWTQMDKVKAIPVTLQGAEAKVIDAVKSGDPKAVGGAVGAMGKTGCGACHGSYRLKMPS